MFGTLLRVHVVGTSVSPWGTNPSGSVRTGGGFGGPILVMGANRRPLLPALAVFTDPL